MGTDYRYPASPSLPAPHNQRHLRGSIERRYAIQPSKIRDVPSAQSAFKGPSPWPLSAKAAADADMQNRLRLPIRPRDFHPAPLTDSVREPLDSYGSCHRTKAAAFR
jgi:hypothetical protein